MSKILKGLKGDSIEVVITEESGNVYSLTTTIESVVETVEGHWEYSFFDEEGNLKTSKNVTLFNS